MTQPDTLHTRLRAELDRRLAVARAAEGADWTLDERAEYGPKVGEWSREVSYQVWHCDDEQDGCPEEARGWIAEARLIAMAVTGEVARLEGELEVLERHAPCACDLAADRPHCRTHRCPANEGYRCAETLSLAHRLGVSVDG